MIGVYAMTGEELRAIRLSWSMTQEEFGRALGYTDKSIANYEHERTPITESLEKHVLALDTLRRMKKEMEKLL